MKTTHSILPAFVLIASLGACGGAASDAGVGADLGAPRDLTGADIAASPGDFAVAAGDLAMMMGDAAMAVPGANSWVFQGVTYTSGQDYCAQQGGFFTSYHKATMPAASILKVYTKDTPAANGSYDCVLAIPGTLTATQAGLSLEVSNSTWSCTGGTVNVSVVAGLATFTFSSVRVQQIGTATMDTVAANVSCP